MLKNSSEKNARLEIIPHDDICFSLRKYSKEDEAWLLFLYLIILADGCLLSLVYI